MTKPAVLVAITATALAAACATPVATLGRPPTGASFSNDGSKDAQARIERRYSLIYADGMMKRPGADPAAVGNEIGAPVSIVAAPAAADETAAYVASSAEATNALTSTSVVIDRGVATYGAPVAVAIGLATGVALGALGLSPAQLAGARRATQPVDLVEDMAEWSMLFGALAYVADSQLVAPLAHSLAAGSYRQAAAAWNHGLDARIEQGAPLSTSPLAGARDDKPNSDGDEQRRNP